MKRTSQTSLRLLHKDGGYYRRHGLGGLAWTALTTVTAPAGKVKVGPAGPKVDVSASST